MNKTQLRQLIREHIKEVFDPAKDKVFMELMAWINPRNALSDWEKVTSGEFAGSLMGYVSDEWVQGYDGFDPASRS